ncbi:DUF1698 domain-containing protein, partial [Salmonella enterica]|uniref:DUF1698 domain-containing protein n=1 Tax=Salmonella enterica TaxID=28901 RepID=UPI00398C45D9
RFWRRLCSDGAEIPVLVRVDVASQIGNVYFIPSAPALKKWLEKCGFLDVRIADVCVTTTEEQRRTDWMVTESLADVLDPNYRNKTVHGKPPPPPAVLVSLKPG